MWEVSYGGLLVYVSYMEEENNDDSQKLDTDYIPKLGIEFGSEQEAYDFYNECGRNSGFSIRKEWCNKRKKDGVVTSRKFTCCKEGNKAPWERDGENKYERAETRTGCNAHMIIRLDKKKGKYFTHSLELNHNHILHIPQCAHMMPSQRKVSKAQAMEIDLAYDSCIKLKDSYEFMARQVGGRDVVGYTLQDQKNYHYSKWQKEQKCDAQMIVDYKLFGDVVSFDTTYKTNKEYRPLAMFVGFNHHRKSTIFGAALLYEETIDTFQWLFKAFFEAMSGKKPNTIFTDQDPAMAKAISLVMPNTYHRLCKWHLMQNALKGVNHLLRGEDEFRSDLDACFKIWEEEEEFLSAWDAILHKYNAFDNSWLQSAFEVKEKWAKAYVKMSFSAGMTTTQLSESINSDLKDYLQSDYDIVKFFIHFERLLDAKRYKELKGEYNLRQKLPKVKIASPMLIQAAHIYTPKLFLKFQEQYEEFQGAFVKEHVERNASHEYIVSIYGKPKDRQDKHLTSPMQVNGAISYNPLPYIDHSVQDLYIPHFSSVGEPCNPSSLSQGKRIRNDQEQNSFGTFENSVNFCGMTNPHVPLPCSKNPSDLEGDDINSLLTKFTTGKIEAFLT
ncbi:protein FAR1-RELATED SEQUENCE 5-like [Castanea sativa]|uniref:protein FAR1-RELATED SEQUENCE 5-like n=1 Tax=Castanea sativa TaxID=21020 RepID=UPI003F64F2BE